MTFIVLHPKYLGTLDTQLHLIYTRLKICVKHLTSICLSVSKYCYDQWQFIEADQLKHSTPSSLCDISVII